MKRFVRVRMSAWVAMVALAAALCACSSSYQMTLIGNRFVTTNSKPKLNKETQNFEFKDHKGQIREIPKSRVLKIEPYNSKTAKNNTYLPEIK